MHADISFNEHTARGCRCWRQARGYHLRNWLGGGACNVGICDSVAVFRAREHQPKQIPVQYGLVGVYLPAWGAYSFDNYDREGDWIKILRCAWHGMGISSFLCPQQRCPPSSRLHLAAIQE